MIEFNQIIVMTGIIMPHNWDENGKVIEVALYTNTEKVYTLQHNSLTPELIGLLQKKVEIKGRIRKHPNEVKSITVQNYLVLEDIIDAEKKTI